MRHIFTTTVVAIIAATLGSGVQARDDKKKEEPAKKAAAAADPTGKWTWSFSAPNGQSFEQTATLTLAGGKVTGTVAGRRGETPISDGTFKDGKLAFSVVRERDGRKMAAKFEGKVEGDVIKGTSTMNRGDGERTVPWEAKRAK